MEARLVEIEGVDSIQKSLKHAKINGEDDMRVDPDPEPYVSPAVLAKRKALANFAVSPCLYCLIPLTQIQAVTSPTTAEGTVSLTFQEAVEIEQRAHIQDKERHQRAMEKKQRQGLVTEGEMLSRQEREARIWAFMSVAILGDHHLLSITLGIINHPSQTWKTTMKLTPTKTPQTGLTTIRMMV